MQKKQQEEQHVFDMAKRDVPFLQHLELVSHDDRPDFVLRDEKGRKIGLEHFRADVYRVQDENSSHVSGGHTILNKSKDDIYQKYHLVAVNNTWTDELIKNASDGFVGILKDSFDMQSKYKYESFLDNLHVGIHGRLPKVNGHIQKSQKYPDRESYDLMGFLIDIPVPSFHYHFETIGSQQISRIKSLLCPLNLQGFGDIPRRYNEAYSFQKINGFPITNEIWKELDIFENIDFIIIETYDAKQPQEHHGQYFDKNTPKPHIYPAFSFGFTDIVSTNAQIEHKNGKSSAVFHSQTNRSKYDVAITTTTLKAERRKQSRKTRKHFDEVTKKFREK